MLPPAPRLLTPLPLRRGHFLPKNAAKLLLFPYIAKIDIVTASKLRITSRVFVGLSV